MTRCLPRALCALALCCTALAPIAPASAQTPVVVQQRNFPDAALRGTLTIVNQTSATVNGQPLRLAPGLRIFSPQGALIFAHTLVGQPLVVNYLIEPNTGMLHTVWILTAAEAALPAKNGGATTTTTITVKVK